MPYPNIDPSASDGAADIFGTMKRISRPASMTAPMTARARPMTTVAYGRYFWTESEIGAIASAKSPNTSTKPTAMTAVAINARSSAADRDRFCPPTTTSAR